MQAWINKNIRDHALSLAVLVAVTLVVYAPALGHHFLINLDDGVYVVRNEIIRGFTWDHVRVALARPYFANYAPLHILSYMLDYTFWGLKPAGFLLANVLLHYLNGVLIYFLLFRISGRKRWGFVGAFIFLLHPVQVESVAWVSQRKNVLAMFFFLASFHFYLSYRTRGAKRSGLAYVLSVISFILSLLSKSVTVILPLVLFLYDLCTLERQDRKRWLVDKVPYGIAAAAIAVVTIISQSPEFGGGRISYHGGSPVITFLTILTVLPRYLRLLFYPTPTALSVLYYLPVKTGLDLPVLGSGLLVVLLGVAGVFLYRLKRKLSFWFFVFFIGFLPVSQIVPLVTLMNDRYMYFPMLGASAFLGSLCLTALEHLQAYRQKGALAVLCVVLLLLPWFSRERVPVWQNDLTLWTDTVGKFPDSEDAWYNLGRSYYDAGQMDNALDAYLRALSINPSAKDTLNNVGNIYMQKGHFLKARPFLLEALRVDPYYFEGLLNLGGNFCRTGEFEQAELTLRKALAIRPRSAQVFLSLGEVYSKTNRLEMASECYRRAVALGARGATIAFSWACVEARRGNSGGAIKLLESAFQLGYRDLESLKKDPDLKSLFLLPEFQHLLYTYFGERAGNPR